MKTKLLILCAIILGFAPLVYGQNLEMGPVYHSDSKYFDPTIVGEDDKHIFLVEYSNDTYILEAFKKKGYKKSYSKKLSIPEMDERKFTFRKIYYSEGHVTAFASHYNKKKKLLICMRTCSTVRPEKKQVTASTFFLQRAKS